MKEASDLGIIIEFTLFSSYYNTGSWERSPLYFKNNVNKLDSIPINRANTMFCGDKLLRYEENLVKKIVSELNEFDNVVFEIQNEPWSDNSNLQAFINLDNDTLYPRSWQKGRGFQFVVFFFLQMEISFLDKHS